MAYPATFRTIKDSVIAKLRLDADADDTRVGDWINQVYADACVETEAIQTASTMTLTADSATYTLPDAVIRMKWMFVTPADGQQSMALEPVTLEQILRWRMAGGSDPVTGSVQYYALSGHDIIDFYPTPGAADTITLYYVKLPGALANDDDVPGISEPYASKLLEYGALAEGADFKRDPSEQSYRAQYASWMQKLKTHLNRKEGGVAKQFDVYGSFPRVSADNSRDIR
jgi:hypothetical protein